MNDRQIHTSFTRIKLREESKRSAGMSPQISKRVLRSVILEKNVISTFFFQRVRDLSDQQAQFLVDDPWLFIQWINQE